MSLVLKLERKHVSGTEIRSQKPGMDNVVLKLTDDVLHCCTAAENTDCSILENKHLTAELIPGLESIYIRSANK